MRELVIIGAGGFGRETLDVVHAINATSPAWQVIGVIDDAPSDTNLARLSARGVPHLGGMARLPPAVDVAVAVGDPATRSMLVASLEGRGHHSPSLVHPSALIGSELQHGEGLVVLGGVSIGTNVALGAHVHLNAHAVIGHDARLCDFVSINPNATVSGECTVGPRTLVGASSTILQQLAIGADTTVGAAACVARDVAASTTVVGVPARPSRERTV